MCNFIRARLVLTDALVNSLGSLGHFKSPNSSSLNIFGGDIMREARWLNLTPIFLVGLCLLVVNPATAQPTLASITGTQDAVIILVEFDDTGAGEGSAGSHNPAYFDSSVDGLVLGSSGGNLANYLDEVSYGQLTLGGIVANNMWHRSDQTEL